MEIKLIPLDLTRPVGLVALQKFLWRNYGVWVSGKNPPTVLGRGVHFFEDRIKIPMMDTSKYGENDFLVVYRRVDELTVDIVGFTEVANVFRRNAPKKKMLEGLKTKAEGGNLVYDNLDTNWGVVGSEKPIQRTLGLV